MEKEKDNLFRKINKLSLPAVILIVGIILSGLYYVSQISKQKSAEKQQEIKLQDDRQLEVLKSKQNECETLSTGVKGKWNNVMGVTYDNDLWKECVVTYTDTKTGGVKISPLRFMETAKKDLLQETLTQEQIEIDRMNAIKKVINEL